VFILGDWLFFRSIC